MGGGAYSMATGAGCAKGGSTYSDTVTSATGAGGGGGGAVWYTTGAGVVTTHPARASTAVKAIRFKSSP